MKHKFSGETCIYCGRAEASTSDHVLGRGFFLADQRANIPQVPACKQCNGDKAKLESYLMVILPFGAKHADSVANIQTLVAKRLSNRSNAKVRRRLERDALHSNFEHVGVDASQLERLFAMIATALAWHHFQVRLGDDFSARGALWESAGRAVFDQILREGRNHVKGDWGNGTFDYEGAQGDYPQETIWRFVLYGGIDFGGDPRVSQPSSLAIAMTAKKETIQNLTYRDFRRQPKTQKVGRNAPCPCGSGKKHKKCHGSGARTV